MIEAAINPEGMPLNPSGIGALSICSLMYENTTITAVYPNEVNALNIYVSANVKLFWMFNNATPSTAQFVVISGK